MRERKFRVAVRQFGPFESAIRKQWEAFERVEQSALELDAVAFEVHPLCDVLLESGALARGDWDVVFLNTDWVAPAYEKRLLLDLSGRICETPPEGFPEGWAPSLLGLQEIGGQILGLPYHDGPECLIYRKDLFEDAGEQAAYAAAHGRPLRVPETWEEYRRVARHFHRPAEHRYGAICAAYPDGHNTVYDFCLQVWTRGGELLDAEGRLRLDTPQAVESLEFLRALVNDGTAVHPKCRELDSVQSGLAFAAGEAALMVNWFGFASMAETVAESRVKGRVGIAPVPHSEGCKGTSLNIYWTLSIAAGSPHREVAWRFVRHCASAEMDKLLTLEGAIGCRRSTWLDEDVNRVIPFYRRMEELHANARELPRRTEWPRIAGVIDQMVLEAISTDEAAEAIARRGQARLGGRGAGQACE